MLGDGIAGNLAVYAGIIAEPTLAGPFLKIEDIGQELKCVVLFK